MTDTGLVEQLREAVAGNHISARNRALMKKAISALSRTPGGDGLDTTPLIASLRSHASIEKRYTTGSYRARCGQAADVIDRLTAEVEWLTRDLAAANAAREAAEERADEWKELADLCNRQWNAAEARLAVAEKALEEGASNKGGS